LREAGDEAHDGPAGLKGDSITEPWPQQACRLAETIVTLKDALVVLDAAGLHQAAAYLSMSIEIAERHLVETGSIQLPGA
jgi:hypothetical protein